MGVLKKAFTSIGKPYPRMHEIDWEDQNIWNSLTEDNTAIFQFEGSFAGQVMRTMKPTSVFEMAIITAMIRPAGESYRDALSQRIPNHNPDPRVEKLLKNTYGYIVFQEQIISFLQEICGLSGSSADTVRRAIGRVLGRLCKKLYRLLQGNIKEG